MMNDCGLSIQQNDIFLLLEQEYSEIYTHK